MKITQKYSHLNGEEFLIVNHNNLYKEINEIVNGIDADKLITKGNKIEIKNQKKQYYRPKLTRIFHDIFLEKRWSSIRYPYYITTDQKLIQELIPLTFKEQSKFIIDNNVQATISDYKKLDFVKEKVAIEVRFDNPAYVAYDLFVKYFLFYFSRIINIGIEILPTKNMQSQMSSGVAYYEGEVYNVLRHGRNNPPVPLLILGIEE